MPATLPGLEQPALELYAITWKLGYLDPVERPLTLLDVLSASLGRELHPEPEERVAGTPLDGATVVRLGEGESARYFALLPWAMEWLHSTDISREPRRPTRDDGR